MVKLSGFTLNLLTQQETTLYAPKENLEGKKL
jgi:hypothetical protein